MSSNTLHTSKAQLLGASRWFQSSNDPTYKNLAALLRTRSTYDKPEAFWQASSNAGKSNGDLLIDKLVKSMQSEVTGTMNEAIASYKKGEYREALRHWTQGRDVLSEHARIEQELEDSKRFSKPYLRTTVVRPSTNGDSQIFHQEPFNDPTVNIGGEDCPVTDQRDTTNWDYGANGNGKWMLSSDGTERWKVSEREDGTFVAGPYVYRSPEGEAPVDTYQGTKIEGQSARNLASNPPPPPPPQSPPPSSSDSSSESEASQSPRTYRTHTPPSSIDSHGGSPKNVRWADESRYQGTKETTRRSEGPLQSVPPRPQSNGSRSNTQLYPYPQKGDSTKVTPRSASSGGRSRPPTHRSHQWGSQNHPSMATGTHIPVF